jgi:hypothetical protein
MSDISFAFSLLLSFFSLVVGLFDLDTSPEDQKVSLLILTHWLFPYRCCFTVLRYEKSRLLWQQTSFQCLFGHMENSSSISLINMSPGV